ncbi:MAG: hypothetical protein ACC726_03965 [Chloroflexota bacterium]
MTTEPATQSETEPETVGGDPSRFVVPAAAAQPKSLLRIRLQLSDRPLVAEGQRVEFGQPIVERFREQEAMELPTTAAVVGMRPGDILDHAPQQPSSRLGRRAAQAVHRTRVIEHGRDGITRLAAGSGDIVIHSPASGFVETLLPGRLDIRTEGLAVAGEVGWGRPSAGRVVIAADGPDSEVQATRIDVAAAGAVLVVGARIDIEAMSRARAIGVAAIVSGSVASRDLRQLAESEIRQQAALHAAAPFGLIALSGYGRLPIPRHLWDMLVAAEGRPAGIDPESRKLLISGDPVPLLAAARRRPGTVRIVAGERRDFEGRLVGLSGLRRWPGGSHGAGGFVEIEGQDGRIERTCLPLSMLELLA